MKMMTPPQPTNPIPTGWQVQWHHRCNGKPRWDVIQKYFTYNEDVNYWTHLHHQGNSFTFYIIYTPRQWQSNIHQRRRDRGNVKQRGLAGRPLKCSGCCCCCFQANCLKSGAMPHEALILPNQCTKQTAQPLSRPTNFLTRLKGAFNHRCVCDPEEEHAALHDSSRQG